MENEKGPDGRGSERGIQRPGPSANEPFGGVQPDISRADSAWHSFWEGVALAWLRLDPKIREECARRESELASRDQATVDPGRPGAQSFSERSKDSA